MHLCVTQTASGFRPVISCRCRGRARAELTERSALRHCECRGLVLWAPVPERRLAAARRRVALFSSAAGGLVVVVVTMAKCASVHGQAMRAQSLAVAERAGAVRAHEKRARVRQVAVTSKPPNVRE